MNRVRPPFVILLLASLAAYGLRDAGQGWWMDEDGRVKGIRPAAQGLQSTASREPTPAGTDGSNIRQSAADREREAFWQGVRAERERRATEPRQQPPEPSKEPMPEPPEPQLLTGALPPVRTTPRSEFYGGGSSSGGYDSLFGLMSVSTNSVKIRVSIPGIATNLSYVHGTARMIIPGTNCSNAGDGFTITRSDASNDWDNTYVFLKVCRTNGHSYVGARGYSFGTGSDTDEVFPLWYIPSNGSAQVDSDNIIDARHTYHWIGGM